MRTFIGSLVFAVVVTAVIAVAFWMLYDRNSSACEERGGIPVRGFEGMVCVDRSVVLK